MKYGPSDEERKAFKEWLIKTDYIAAPQKIYTDERVFERQEVCRDYLEREELKVIASPFHRPRREVLHEMRRMEAVCGLLPQRQGWHKQ